MAAISGSKDKTSASGVEFLSKDIDFYKFTGYTAVETNAGNADSVYHKLIQAVASEANIVVIGAPASNDIVLGLEGGYQGAGSTGAAAQLEAVADAATGINGTVAATTISGDQWS